MNDKEKLRIAKHFCDISDPWDIDYATPDEVMQEIENDGFSAVEYLLQIIDGVRPTK